MKKTTFISVLLISLLALTTNAQNLITNGDFSAGTTSWSKTQSGAATATFSVVLDAANNVANITSTTLGTASGNIQLLQSNIKLGQNKWYTLSFRAKSSVVGNQIKAGVGLSYSPYSSYLSKIFTLSTTWTNYSVNFSTTPSWFPVATPSSHQFVLQCGLNLGDFYFDDIQLNEVSMHTNTALTFTPRTNFPNSRYDPKDVVFHGAGQYDLNSFSNYQNTLSSTHTPTVYMPYYVLSTLTSTWGMDLKSGLNTYPQWVLSQIGLNLTLNNIPYTDNINLGNYDTQIDYLVQGIKDLARPVYLRIGFECNAASNAYNPTSYKNAFIRITNKLRAANVEAATVWNLVVSASTAGTTISDFYPGDQYVDWVSFNLFSSTNIGNTSCTEILNFAKTKNKPVLIGESTPRYVGVLGGQTSWDAWFYPYFKFIADNPGIKMFCYINWNWANYPSWATWGDAQIQDNQLVAANYDEEMNSSLYFHGASEFVTRSIFSNFTALTNIAHTPKTKITYHKGFLYFIGLENDNFNVEIYNLNGILIKKCALTGKSISVKELKNGLYMVRLKGEAGSLIQLY